MTDRLAPVKRHELIRRLERLDWEQERHSDHLYMHKPDRMGLRIPNQKEIPPGLLRQILKQAGITVEEWHAAAKRRKRGVG